MTTIDATTTEAIELTTQQPSVRPRLDIVSRDVRRTIRPLLTMAVNGLARMYLPESQTVGQTLRGIRTHGRVTTRLEGTSDRYAAIVALGLSRLDPDHQTEALAGATAATLALATADRAGSHEDLGVLALAAWAAAEAAGEPRINLFARLARNLSGDAPISTVVAAWSLTAALATEPLVSGDRGRLDDVIRWATRRLLSAQTDHGLFPHFLPPRLLGKWRAHVGCFADQVYPLQALARLAAAKGNADARAAAATCAIRITSLQGSAGQWWWHYDVRNGTVLEGYPVYSVHQHAMAPMALFDLTDAGGADRSEAIGAGVRWLTIHPEVFEGLAAPEHSVIWRKVGRREPRKVVRSAAALLSSYHIGARIPGRDRLFPPTEVDHECRPYELGWLLYAWHRPGLAGSHRG